MTRFIFAALATGWVLAGKPIDAQERPVDSIQERIVLIEKLLNDSSAARQVKEGNVQAAIDFRDQAKRKYTQALEAQESGDVSTASADLSEAIMLMYAAVRATRQEGGTTGKTRRDFRNRRASVDALLTAHQRITTAEGQQTEHDRLRQLVEKDLRLADDKTGAGDFVAARHHLDSAYDKVKLSVEQLREGDTLIRELNFATRKDEYLYELDRNDTHKMLITVLLKERLANERLRERVATLLATADDLRQKAESQAEDKQYATAIETLERSTRELVQAIRGAGVYIPG